MDKIALHPPEDIPSRYSRVLKTPEAAKYVGLAPGTLEKRRVYGGGPMFIKYSNGAVRYLEADLDSFRATHRFASTSEAEAI